MHLLPSRGRPQGLQRFFDEGKPEQPGLVILESDQLEAYRSVQMPSNWCMLDIGSLRRGYAASANEGFAYLPNEPWYGMVSDDCVGRTPHWDSILAEAAAPNRIVWPNDLFRGACTFPVVGGDLCRAVGWFVHPKLWHMFTDTLWWDVQKALKTGGYREDVVLEHMHYVNGKAKMDTTYRERTKPTARRYLGGRPFSEDAEAYAHIKAYELPILLEKIRCSS